MKPVWRLFCAFILLAGIFAGLNRPISSLPPLGTFFNPFQGFWQNGRQIDYLPLQVSLLDLQRPVIVQWDKNRVPHLFAESDADLYCAQGYLVARDRLWQMDMQTRAAAGCLSQIFGKRALEDDRLMRRIGLSWAAEKNLNTIMSDSLCRLALDSFSRGVNAYIDQLDFRDFPLEYKLLNDRPQPWSPLRTALLLKQMAWYLTGYGNHVREKRMANVYATLDSADIERFYPDRPPLGEPIVPAGTPWRFSPVPPRTDCETADQPADSQFPIRPAVPVSNEYALGSNNWAVSGSRTRSGAPILCNDPHLGLGLPSVWYEMQLSSPHQNVYGVTFPGAPGIVIGFTSSLAWGVTNAETDVADWFRIYFTSNRSTYRYADGFRPVTARIETLQVRGSPALIDTVLHTHHGPVVFSRDKEPTDSRMPVDAALCWSGHRASNELATFLWLNRAATVSEADSALRGYVSPGQNFILADADGNIAIRHTGGFPIRRKGQGRLLLDGSDPSDEWSGWIPFDHLPAAHNPRQGFLSSANQIPADSTYPYYLSGNYFAFERGNRINEILHRRSDWNGLDMAQVQRDVLNPDVPRVLPRLLRILLQKGVISAWIDTLETWNGEYRKNLIAPSLYEAWWQELESSLWENHLHLSRTGLPRPRWDVTLKMLLQPTDDPFFDDSSTFEVETLVHWTTRSFERALEVMQQQHGEPGASWRWGEVRKTDIPHLLRFPSFGRHGLSVDGEGRTVSAVTHRTGPTWCMIVELTRPVRAWGTYPGGQSGHPGSLFYDDRIDGWINGQVEELLYLENAGDHHPWLIAGTRMEAKP
ncbi:penicillin acylase family protein [candidate division KSB1 bacterium]|nr:penicillin acylase family protein [candidate division KSB1 bacterium]